MIIQLRNFNKSLLIFFYLMLATGSFNRVAAFDCTKYKDTIADPRGATAIVYALCPLQGAINIGLYFVGAALIIMILYGAIKAITSVGDPKQLEGAKSTWSYAVYGFLIILLSLTIVTIAFALFGSDVTPFNVTIPLWNSITELNNSIGIYTP